MAVYTKDGNAISLNKIWAYAKTRVEEDLVSGLFERSPLLAFLTGQTRNANETELMRPGALSMIGGGRNLSAVEQAKERNIEVHQRVLVDRTGGVKIMGERDTTPSTGNKSQDQNVRTALWRFTGVYSAPIKIWNETLRNSQGDFEIASATQEAVDQAREELRDRMALDLWRAAPTDQSANVWDNMLGVIHALNDDNTYANLDRSTTTFTPPSGAASQITNFWAGIRDTTARTPTVDLVDTAMYDLTIPMNLRNSMPPNLWLCGNSAFHSIKKEALARVGQAAVAEIPEFARLGLRFDTVQYGDSTFVADPQLTGDWSSYDSDITDATKVVAGLYTEDWVFSTHPSENFRVTEFKDQGELMPGGDDAITAEIRVKPRLRCKRPWRSVLFTNVG